MYRNELCRVVGCTVDELIQVDTVSLIQVKTITSSVVSTKRYLEGTGVMEQTRRKSEMMRRAITNTK